MARLARIKAEDSGAFYHLCGRVAGTIGEYPLNSKTCRRKIVEFLKAFSSVYCCKIIGFCIMGNHYHLVIRMDDPRPMSREELWKRAALLYPETVLKAWFNANWERFEKRIFDVSELMRSVQSKIARWFNFTYNRRGRFWADRFKSVLLEDEKAAFDCLLYVELNPVRAGIVKRPEDHDGSSLYYREMKDDKWMMPLTEVARREKRSEAMRDYKACVYYRGSVPTKEGQAAISKRLLAEEEAHGFATEGVFRKRIRHLTDGVVIGSAEYVQRQIDRLREAEQYLRRKNPIKHFDGAHTALRPQRGAA